ncbi:fatty acid desaturase [Laspinema sp. D1]|uniref:Fatty acid desaturase n=1 Tax=Laspinema palackyanum D2a TaxID=2953684 RepID=A0ABT2MX96_9CYAN|nr:fatty acid desaturase [Laspinema sp. D2a]
MQLESIPNSPENKSPVNWVITAFFIAIHGLALLAPWCFSWSALGVMLLLHWFLGSIGICLGYHRLLSHRSFQVSKWLEYTIALVGASALQGGPIFWTAGHRLHHAYTEDEIKDPYSARKGFWWSHLLWMIYPRPEFFNKELYNRFAPDLARDPFYCWLDRYSLLMQVPLAVVLYLLGGWPFIVYGVFVRIVLLWHSTWLINSVTHLWGYKTFPTEDNSRNLWWAAIFTYGEGWHNNHHAYPNVAKAGWRWWELDMTWWAIWLLKTVGLAKKVVMPPANKATQG